MRKLQAVSIQSFASDVFVTALFRQLDLPLSFFEPLGAIVIEFADAMRARNALPIVRLGVVVAG